MVRISALGTIVVSEGSKHRAYVPLLDNTGKLDSSVIPTNIVFNQVIDHPIDGSNVHIPPSENLLEVLDRLENEKLSKAANLSDVVSTTTSRLNLGLGTMATQNRNAVSITGGAIDNVVIGGNTPVNGFFNNIRAQGTLISSNIIRGTGDPNTIVEGVKGNIYQRLDGSSSQTIYVKEDNTLNTGWHTIITSGLNFDPSQYSLIGHKHSPSDTIFSTYNNNLNVPLTAVITDIKDALTSKLGIADNLVDLQNKGTARYNLGLGSIATQNSNSVSITGGNIDGTVIGLFSPASAIFRSLLVQLDITARNIRRGTGSPIGLVTGNRGDIYQRLDGTIGSSLYLKEGGTANSTAGWTPIGGGGGGGGGGSGDIEVTVQEVLARLVIGEIPDGDVDGTNIHFITAYHFELGTTCVYLNGLRQRLAQDYTENSDHTLQFFTAPYSQDVLVLDYVKSAGN